MTLVFKPVFKCTPQIKLMAEGWVKIKKACRKTIISCLCNKCLSLVWPVIGHPLPHFSCANLPQNTWIRGNKGYIGCIRYRSFIGYTTEEELQSRYQSAAACCHAMIPRVSIQCTVLYPSWRILQGCQWIITWLAFMNLGLNIYQLTMYDVT